MSRIVQSSLRGAQTHSAINPIRCVDAAQVCAIMLYRFLL